MAATTEVGQSIDWQRDVDGAMEQSRTDHRPLLLDFTAAPQ